MGIESGVGERKKVTTVETPPANNDCCPIRFSDFAFPCRTDCDHWFCASCILVFWLYGAVLRPCKRLLWNLMNPYDSHLVPLNANLLALGIVCLLSCFNLINPGSKYGIMVYQNSLMILLFILPHRVRR